MKVFDFDNTIYNGESSFDFALFMVKKKKSLLKYLPHLLYFLILYKLCLLSPDDFVKRLEKFMNVFIENKEAFKINMWVSLDKDVFINITF